MNEYLKKTSSETIQQILQHRLIRTAILVEFEKYNILKKLAENIKGAYTYPFYCQMQDTLNDLFCEGLSANAILQKTPEIIEGILRIDPDDLENFLKQNPNITIESTQSFYQTCAFERLSLENQQLALEMDLVEISDLEQLTTKETQ